MKITISKEPYNDKSMAKAAICSAERKNYKSNTGNSIKAIKWVETSIEVKDFYALILSGYSWTTGLYKTKLLNEASNNSKGLVKKKNASGVYKWMRPFDNGCINNGWIKEDWWSGSYCIFVDVDNTKYSSIEDYCSNIQDLLPTFGFYSPSDKPNSRRFKLVWVFNQSISDAELWKAISDYIHNTLNNIEQLKDKCGTVLTQVSYGNKGGCGVFFGNTYDSFMFYHLKESIKTEEEKEAEDNGKTPDSIQIDENLVNKLQRNFSLSDLKYIDYTSWIWRKEDEIDWVSPDKFPIAKMGLCKKDYWELNYNFGQKIKDGGERRKKLFMRMCLRRILKPNATPEEILLNAYRDREYIIDNSDGVVSIDNLVRNVKVSFSYTPEELEDMFKDSIKYLKQHSPSIVFAYYKDRKKYSRQEYNIIKGKFTQYLISKTYDPNLTEAGNIEKFNNSMDAFGYKFRIEDREILRKYRNDNSISKKGDRDNFIVLKHNEGLNATQIIEALVNNGFESMSKRQINRIIAKSNNSTTEITPKIEEKEEPEFELILDPSYFLSGWGIF